MAPNPYRYPTIDYIRGFYVVLMVIFHTCFLLADYELLGFDFYRDPFWLHSRTFIVTGFLTIVGISLALANENGFKAKPYFRRLITLIFYAAIVSITTYMQLEERWVYFGILHFIAFASVIGVVLVRFRESILIVGIAFLIVGNIFANDNFVPKWINWIGFSPTKPATNDYVPVFPWIGVVFIGIYIGHYISSLQTTNGLKRLLMWQSQNWLARLFNLLGKQALHIYIIHIPLIVLAIEVFTAVF